MNAPQPTTPFPVGTNPRKERVADWVELVALATALPFKRGDLKSALSREDIANPDMLEELTWAELSSRIGAPARRRAAEIVRGPFRGFPG